VDVDRQLGFLSAISANLAGICQFSVSIKIRSLWIILITTYPDEKTRVNVESENFGLGGTRIFVSTAGTR